MANRAAAESKCLQRMKELDPSGRHYEHYKELFSKMNNKEFDDYMQGLISGKNKLNAYITNYDENSKITTENNVQLAKKLGYEFYQRIWVTDPVTGIEYLTPRKHMVVETNVCRQVQTLDHKISVPEKNNQIDELTGQVRGDSRASQLSGPEMMVLNSQGLSSPIAELMKFRGGDNDSNRKMNYTLETRGEVSMNEIPSATSQTNRSVKTLSSILIAMMFANNF